MKNLKKVLALAVAFVMCFTMFAGAAVFSDVPVGGDYSQAITFLSDIQVIAGKPDGSFGVNDAITRADAACLIARMMTGQMNPPKYDKHVAFSDVEVGSYYESAVGYCAALGITSGTGNGQFSPKRTITDGEFVAMLTRALGYDTAENPLSYPMGNIVVAQAKGLLDGVNIDYMSDALRGEDAQMLYNAVFADYDRAAKNKNVYQAADDHYTVTIAEEVFDLARLSHDDDVKPNDGSFEMGFHGANKNTINDCDVHTWVIAGVDARNRENTYVAFAIDDSDEKAITNLEDNTWAYQEFTYTGNPEDVKKMLGFRVELWGEMDHSNPVWDVRAIKVLDGQSEYAYNAGMYTADKKVEVDGKTLYINDRDNQVNMANINLDLNTAARRNWATETEEPQNPVFEGTDSRLDADDLGYAYRLARVNADPDQQGSRDLISVNSADGDQFRLVDWDSDDYIDFVVRETYKYGEVKSVSKSRVVLEVDDGVNGNRGEYALKLDDDNLKVTGADGLKEGDIVEISLTSRVYTRSDKEVVTINLSAISPENLKLEKINLTKDTYVLDGEERVFADEDLFDLVEEDDSREELRTTENIGKQFNVWLDRNGFMLKARVSDDSSTGYLMVLDTVDGNRNLNGNVKRYNAALDVLFDDNTVGEEVPVVTDLRIDGENDGSTGYSRNGNNVNGRTWTQELVVGNVYKYFMNDDGEITRLQSQTNPWGDAIQTGNYSFDESKDRIGVHVVDGLNDENGSSLTSSVPVRRNRVSSYSFADDAAIFVVRKTTTTDQNANGTVDGRGVRGYVQISPLSTYNATANAGDVRYYVDPDDVMAVKVDDLPEIDNRWNTTNPKTAANPEGWTTAPTEVTHPATFIDTTAQNPESFATNLFPNYTWVNRTTAERAAAAANYSGNGWMYWTDNGDYANDGTIWNANPAYVAASTGTQTWYAPASERAAVVPSAVIHTDRNSDVDAAILGVDSFDFMGQATVKLALITDVTAIGGKTYEVTGAIDGKVGDFKTIAGYEDKIFTGNDANGNPINSLNDMQSYLNLQLPQYNVVNGVPTDEFRGARNGLYCEVTMNADGLITEVRAMDVVRSLPAFWGTDSIQTTFMQGRVYRVIRGVTASLGSKNQVTWQTSPTASSDKTLYPMSKNADRNGFDHLEGFYDEDTKFYSIDELPNMVPDVRTWIELGFKDNLNKKLEVADSGVLVASTFIEEGDGSDLYLCDYAVYKNDLDRLAAVFAFKECTNTGVERALELAATDVQEGTTVSPMMLKVEVIKTQSANAGVDSTHELKAKFVNDDGTKFDITFDGRDADEQDTADNLLTALDTAKTNGDIDYADITDADGVTTNNSVNQQFLIVANAGEEIDLDVSGIDESVLDFEIRVTKIPAVEKNQEAISRITVPNGQYDFARPVTVEVKGENGVLKSDPVSFVIPAGSYNSVEIASRIAAEANAKTGLEASIGAAGAYLNQTNPGSQNVVTIHDYTLGSATVPAGVGGVSHSNGDGFIKITVTPAAD